ncbi:MAG: TIGR02117 family protein [Rhodocyclaceae bacterium]
MIWLLAILCCFVVTYAGAMAVLGVVPMHRPWRPASQGVTVWLTTNGVHASLAFPARAAGIDWHALLPPGPALAATRGKPLPAHFDYVEIGWGDRRFFIDTPRWRDLKVSTALWAASGLDATLMHVEYLPRPAPGPRAIPIVLSEADYLRLARYTQAAFLPDAQGRPQQLAGHSYGDYDVFFEARGHYNLFFTCNEWVRRALGDIGVRTPVWAPFDWSLFWQLRRVAD